MKKKHVMIGLLCVMAIYTMGQHSERITEQITESCDSIIGSEDTTDISEIFYEPEFMPEFPGGAAALFRWIDDNLQYPGEAYEKGIQGRAICQFVVDRDGSIIQPQVVRSSGDSTLDAEALRLMHIMPRWKPAMRKNHNTQEWEYVRVVYTIPFRFKIVQDSTMQIMP